jgi:threonylcarbamoyladenosine tRNA methylthiotransferase MtaB
VTAKADSESLRIIRKAAAENLGALILVTGCLTQNDSDKERIRMIKGVSAVLENSCKERMPDLIPDLAGAGPAVGTPGGTRNIRRGISFFQGRSRAFLKIQDGCDNRCSYCKVALVRGRSRSRREEDILEEAGLLAENGYKEIVLTGICLGAYGRDKEAAVSLAGLIRKISRIERVGRIRLSSIEMTDVSAELLALFSEGNKLCPHFHVPLQSGDDRVLSMMRRRYNRKTFLEGIGRIKKNVPDVSITTDVIVGFPGEDDASFADTLKAVREIKPLKTHIFPYSSRQGTAAAEMPGQLNREIIKERCALLSSLADGCSREYMQGFIGRETEIMAEDAALNSCRRILKSGYSFSCADKKPLIEGYSANYIRVLIPSAIPSAGKEGFFRVRLVKVVKDCMLGDLF